jgi:hypothetical protein
MNQSTEKLLIQTYKHLDQSRHLLEQLINQFGMQHERMIQLLPPDIQYLVQLAMELTPEQRKTLRLFLESIKDKS